MKITVDIDNSGSRLDKFLAKNGFGFALSQKLLRQKDVKVNNIRASAEYRLEEDDQIEIFIKDDPTNRNLDKSNKKPEVSKEKINLIKQSIIYQDDNLLAIDKPAGIAVQSGNPKDFSIDAALPFLKLDSKETPRLIHRLDRETSGILLLARNRKTAALLSEAFKNKTINKTYLAIVKGVPSQENGTISIPLLEKNFGNFKKVFKDNAGKPAITHYKILKSFENFTLLELKPITGRMHQLRVHCKEIGHPIVGDRKYGLNNKIEFGSIELSSRLYLHAFRIELSDFFGKKLVIKTEDPDFINVISSK